MDYQTWAREVAEHLTAHAIDPATVPNALIEQAFADEWTPADVLEIVQATRDSAPNPQPQTGFAPPPVPTRRRSNRTKARSEPAAKPRVRPAAGLITAGIGCCLAGSVLAMAAMAMWNPDVVALASAATTVVGVVLGLVGIRRALAQRDHRYQLTVESH